MKLSFLKMRALAVHSNTFPYSTDVPVRFKLIAFFIVAQAGFIIQYDTVQPPPWYNNLSLAGKRPVWIKSPLTQTKYLREVPGFRSAGHKCHHRMVENQIWLPLDWIH